MEERNKKRQIAKITVFITSIFVIFISISYAFITQTLAGTKKQVINAGVLDLVLEEDNEITITDALPMYDEVGMLQEENYVFRLINNTSTDTNYVLKLNKIQTSNLDENLVKYGLVKDGKSTIALLSTLENGVIDEGTIEGSATQNYELRLWIDSSVTDNTLISGKTLSYTLSVEVNQEIEQISFVNSLESKVDVNTTIDFKKISSATNGRGIYKYTEDGEDIYYWRGKVDEAENSANHVIFGGYCWEMVRTTKTGGIKMIYDGEPVEVDGVKTCPNTGSTSNLSVGTKTFNSSHIDNAYVGYMYGLTGVTAEPSSPQCIKLNSAGTAAEVGTETTKEACEQAGGKWATTAYESTHANVVNSTIKGVIDEWFRTSNLNTEENLEKIEDTVYCNDRSIDQTAGSSNNGYTGYTTLGYGINKTVYNAAVRVGDIVGNPVPSLECNQENDRFTVSNDNGNGDLIYPIGLLTADEIALAGGKYGSSNTDYYLYTGQYYWAMSPYYFNRGRVFEFGVKDDGYNDAYSVENIYGVRPAISLVSGTPFVEGGTGTASNPYVVE